MLTLPSDTTSQNLSETVDTVGFFLKEETRTRFAEKKWGHKGEQTAAVSQSNEEVTVIVVYLFMAARKRTISQAFPSSCHMKFVSS